MTKEEFESEAECGEFHTIVYDSTSHGPDYKVHMFIKRFDDNAVLVMNDQGKFIKIRYSKIKAVV